MKNNIAIFPGSFDPITLGHVDIINRCIKVFPNITILVSMNIEKKYMFNAEERVTMIKKVFEKNKKISIVKYNGLTVDFCLRKNISHIVRGVRDNRDFEYEQTLSYANKALAPDIETICLFGKKENTFISSSIVKDVMKNGGNMEYFLPKEIIPYVSQKINQQKK